MKKLKGMTWNHERGIRPLQAAAEKFQKEYDAEVEWDARSLSDFELYPLEKLAEEYDLIMIDHPHIGIAHKEKLLLPLEKVLAPSYLNRQKEGSVGKSYESYQWEGHQYAIPLDAAAQTAAVRKDLLGGRKIPETWKEVMDFAENLPEGKRIALTLEKVHAYSSFFTLCSQISQKEFWSNGEDLEEEAGEEALRLLRKLYVLSDQDCADWNPIELLDHMMEKDDIVYCPLVYEYSNYARDGYGRCLVHFCNLPKKRELPEGSMIGGVGLSISGKSRYQKEAVAFLKMTADPDYQKKEFVQNGGQPGHKDAWMDERANEITHGFFKDTLETMEYGSMRPRFAGYIDFQEIAGKRIRELILQQGSGERELVRNLNSLIRKCRANQGLRQEETENAE